jgi:general secretion pathway protein K
LAALTPLGATAGKQAKAEVMRHRGEEGIALIAVLWMLTLLSVVAAALSLETRSSTRIARNMAGNAAARAAADAGIQRAILNLLAPDADTTFRADGTVNDWHFADSDVRISLRNEGVKVNLNQAREVALVALFSSVGVDLDKAQSLADAIADFRDADDLKHLHGAEKAEYRAAGLAWGPKNADFEAVEELQQVLGMTAAIYERVAPDLTTYSYSTGSSINPSERLTEILRKAGVEHALVFARIAYSIRAEAKSSNGGAFVREAVVELPKTSFPRILSWRHGAPRLASVLGRNARQ